MKSSSRLTLAVSVLLLLVWFALRMTSLEHFPVFIDETVHIHTAERISQTSPLVDAQLGRLFTIWAIALFQPTYSQHPIWLSRCVIMLLGMISIACGLALARQKRSVTGVLVWGLLVCVSAYHFFFERLALSDGLSAVGVLSAILVASRLQRRVRWGDALLCGVCLFMAFGAKFGALPYYGIPIAAALTLWSPKTNWQKQLLWMSQALGTALLLTVLFVIGHRLFGYDIWSNSFSLALSNRSDFSASNTFNLTRILSNAQNTFVILSQYWGVVGFLIVVLGTLYALWKRDFFTLLVCFAPLLAMWMSLPQETRYWIAAAYLLLLLGARLLADAAQSPVILVKATSALACLGIFVPGIMTIYAYQTDSSGVWAMLPEQDRRQYVLSDAAGTPFAEIGRVLREQHPSSVLGLLASCQGLRYTLWDEQSIQCPRINPNGESIPELLAWVDANRGAHVFAVLESSSYLPSTLDATVVTEIQRPSGLASLTIYDLTP